jgi:sugar phosphate isomerase/epimerase
MPLDRRTFLASTAVFPALNAWAGENDRKLLGAVIHSFSIQSAEKGFSDPVRFLDHVHRIGGRGVQVGIGVREESYAESLRARAESNGMYLEGTLDLPRDDSALGRFAAEVRTAKRAGVSVLRTVAFRGRRYETFDSLEAFQRAEALAIQAIRRAVPVVEQEGVKLAIENHKDWRVDEFIRVLKQIGSDHVGVCLDLGNSIALLEDPMEVVEALVPWTFTTHLKDMAVEEYPDGFLLSEVPLGTGVLDLDRMVRLIRTRHPDVKFNIEMITRDPLKVPCLIDRYWATFPQLSGRSLARSLRFVRGHKPSSPLPKISPLPPEQRVQEENRNVEKCLAYGRDRLGL